MALDSGRAGPGWAGKARIGTNARGPSPSTIHDGANRRCRAAGYGPPGRGVETRSGEASGGPDRSIRPTRGEAAVLVGSGATGRRPRPRGPGAPDAGSRLTRTRP